MSKFSICLPGSEHADVQVKLKRDPLSVDRVADVKFPSGGMDVKLYMMESDLRILAHAILANTNHRLDN